MNENVERTLNEEPKERTLMKEHMERMQKVHRNAKMLKELTVAWNENDEYHPPIEFLLLLRQSPFSHFCSSSTRLVGSSTSFVMTYCFATFTYRIVGKGDELARKRTSDQRTESTRKQERKKARNTKG